MNRATVALIILILFCVTAPCAFSHPHVFIENSFSFVFGDNGLEGVIVRWIFDEIFSASIIMDNDRNRNGVFEENEIKTVEKGAFSNLANFNYFLYIDIGGGKAKIKAVREFTAEIAGCRLAYRFFVPLKVEAGKAETTIRAGCFDNTYYCDVAYSKNEPVRTESNDGVVCLWEFAADKKNAYWGGSIIPKIVRLRFRKKCE